MLNYGQFAIFVKLEICVVGALLKVQFFSWKWGLY